jgi:hypothetical protein
MVHPPQYPDGVDVPAFVLGRSLEFEPARIGGLGGPSSVAAQLERRLPGNESSDGLDLQRRIAKRAEAFLADERLDSWNRDRLVDAWLTTQRAMEQPDVDAIWERAAQFPNLAAATRSRIEDREFPQ